MTRLKPLDSGLLDLELKRRLDVALEFEGWQEAETIYAEVHSALRHAPLAGRARALMDHAMVLRRVGKEAQAAQAEASAESLLGESIEREQAPKSSVDELIEEDKKKKGWLGWFK